MQIFLSEESVALMFTVGTLFGFGLYMLNLLVCSLISLFKDTIKKS